MATGGYGGEGGLLANAEPSLRAMAGSSTKLVCWHPDTIERARLAVLRTGEAPLVITAPTGLCALRDCGGALPRFGRLGSNGAFAP